MSSAARCESVARRASSTVVRAPSARRLSSSRRLRWSSTNCRSPSTSCLHSSALTRVRTCSASLRLSSASSCTTSVDSPSHGRLKSRSSKDSASGLGSNDWVYGPWTASSCLSNHVSVARSALVVDCAPSAWTKRSIMERTAPAHVAAVVAAAAEQACASGDPRLALICASAAAMPAFCADFWYRCCASRAR